MAKTLTLNENAPIYQLLKKLSDGDNWWTRLKEDKDIYIDIRQGDTINVYHNGGSLLKINSSKSAEINYAYLPTGENNTYAACKIDKDKIDLKKTIEITLSNMSKEKIAQLMKIIGIYYPKDSEKGIQGAYATEWKKDNCKEKSGFFIDTELQDSKKGRIDLIYLDYDNPNKPVLYFVELKTKGDNRLWDDTSNSEENICGQLEKYKNFINDKEAEIIDYYKTLYNIKKELGLIPKDAAEKVKIENLSIKRKPVLLIGDATNNFIYKNNSKELSEQMENLKKKIEKQDCACMIICRGIKTNTLNFHSSQSGNVFVITPQNDEEKC